MGHVFLSYAGADREYVERLAAEARRRLIEVWFDREIESGSRWAEVIEEKVRHCSAFAPILTPASRVSEWCQRELLLADQLQKPVFPLLLKATKIPLTLLDRQYLDLRNQKMPTERWFASLAATNNAVAQEAVNRPVVVDQSEILKPTSELHPPAQTILSHRGWSSVITPIVGSGEELTFLQKHELPKRPDPKSRTELVARLSAIEQRLNKRAKLNVFQEAGEFSKELARYARADVSDELHATAEDREMIRYLAAMMRKRREVNGQDKSRLEKIPKPRSR